MHNLTAGLVTVYCLYIPNQTYIIHVHVGTCTYMYIICMHATFILENFLATTIVCKIVEMFAQITINQGNHPSSHPGTPTYMTTCT